MEQCFKVTATKPKISQLNVAQNITLPPLLLSVVDCLKTETQVTFRDVLAKSGLSKNTNMIKKHRSERMKIEPLPLRLLHILCTDNVVRSDLNL